MASSDGLRWARVRPDLAWQHPGLPIRWTRVLERNPDEVAALPGYVWLDTPAKVLHVSADDLESTDVAPTD